MASSTRSAIMTLHRAAMLAAPRTALNGTIGSRALSTAACKNALRPSARPSVAIRLQNSGRIAFRRAYADGAPKPKPGIMRRTFRWAWRATYISLAGVLGYGCYIIWLDRHPPPQFDPDPTKKTLVVLGEFRSHCRRRGCLADRL